MSNFDRQLVNVLVKIHREMFGGRMDNHCQWYYDAKTDIYHCPHTAVYGKDLALRIPDWAELYSDTPAYQAWKSNPNNDHKL